MLTACGRTDEPVAQTTAADGNDYTLGNVIRFGKGGGSEAYRLSGWSDTEKEFTWTTGQSATLLLTIPKVDHPLKLRMRLGGFIKAPELPFQPVEVLANDQKIGDWQVSSPKEFTALIPAEIANQGQLTLEIRMPKATSPQSVGVSEDSRVLGVNCFYLALTKAGE
ncbi:MAG: hypothetical protein ABR589_08010 [Chthoniobacterales bacterium]